MRKQLLLGIVSVSLLAVLALFGQRVFAQDPTPSPAPGPSYPARGLGRCQADDESRQAPNTITSLPMSNPYCSQPDPSVNQCFVNVRYFQANDNGSGNVLAYVNLSIDGKLRYRSNAFFENFVAYSFDMIPGGIKVACGRRTRAGMEPSTARATPSMSRLMTSPTPGCSTINCWSSVRLSTHERHYRPPIPLAPLALLEPPAASIIILFLGLLLALTLPGELAHATQVQPAALTLTMSNPSCVEMLPASGDCSIEISSLSASSSAPDFARLEVLVDGKLRVFEGGFFESSGYLTHQHAAGRAESDLRTGGRRRVSRVMAGLIPSRRMHTWRTAPAASDSATVFCPAFDGQMYLPLVAR